MEAALGTWFSCNHILFRPFKTFFYLVVLIATIKQVR